MERRTSQRPMEAAALKYDPGDSAAPVVVALGKGVTAERIMETAKQSEVPIVRDPDLAHMLSKLSVGDDIPEELYSVVAQILVFINQMDGSYSKYLEYGRQ